MGQDNKRRQRKRNDKKKVKVTFQREGVIRDKKGGT